MICYICSSDSLLHCYCDYRCYYDRLQKCHCGDKRNTKKCIYTQEYIKQKQINKEKIKQINKTRSLICHTCRDNKTKQCTLKCKNAHIREQKKIDKIKKECIKRKHFLEKWTPYTIQQLIKSLYKYIEQLYIVRPIIEKQLTKIKLNGHLMFLEFMKNIIILKKTKYPPSYEFPEKIRIAIIKMKKVIETPSLFRSGHHVKYHYLFFMKRQPTHDSDINYMWDNKKKQTPPPPKNIKFTWDMSILIYQNNIVGIETEEKNGQKSYMIVDHILHARTINNNIKTSDIMLLNYIKLTLKQVGLKIMYTFLCDLKKPMEKTISTRYSYYIKWLSVSEIYLQIRRKCVFEFMRGACFGDHKKSLIANFFMINCPGMRCNLCRTIFSYI